MSTRALYVFLNSEESLKINYLSKWDNYPSGAARRFHRMMDYADKNFDIGYTEAFLLANPDVIFSAESKTMLKDIDYKYVISRSGRMVAQEKTNGADNTFGIFFTGDIEEFLGKYMNLEEEERFDKLSPWSQLEEEEQNRVEELLERVKLLIHEYKKNSSLKNPNMLDNDIVWRICFLDDEE